MANSVSFGLKSFSVSKPLHKAEPLLDQVSAYVNKGGITAVLGASGSGKSVLLQAVSGMRASFDILHILFLLLSFIPLSLYLFLSFFLFISCYFMCYPGVLNLKLACKIWIYLVTCS